MLWFFRRLKNGDLFKGYDHTPVLSKINDIYNYRSLDHRNIDVIIDANEMSLDNAIALYETINYDEDSKYIEVELSTIDRVSDTLSLVTGHYGRCKIQVWVNNSPEDLLEHLWEIVKEPLFHNIPKTTVIGHRNPDILHLAHTKGVIELHTVAPAPRRSITVDILRNKVFGTTSNSTQLSQGDIRLGSKSVQLVNYELKSPEDWILVKSDNSDASADLYVPMTAEKPEQWYHYMGRCLKEDSPQ